MLCLKIGRSWIASVSGWPAMAIRGFSKEVVTPEMLADTKMEMISPNETQHRIFQIRNRSNLKPYHRRQLHEKPPYVHRVHWLHDTLKYQQKLYGTYGVQSKIDPKICWMTTNALKDKKEKERITHPFSLQKMLKVAEDRRLYIEERIRLRQKTIEDRLLKLNQWRRELKERVDKKEALANAAKAKKEKLIEEVRRHFGFKMNPKDERFQNLLVEKEKQQKKADRAAKLAARDSLMIKKLQEKNAEIK
ncbi:growth arrest and DNA damage-inducible proteins-interacting protein CRIF [Arctopsyche grandis]|uniref:growth arrest and DNA damage-inducible proteins-interacting protein CRIF n=1 Tax=Arctopsyche grandis TaxID=121162 RepID=UPI00406DA471